MNINYDGNYKTKYEFKQSVKRHAEIVFEWKGTDYEIFWSNGEKWIVCVQDDKSKDVCYDTLDGVMNHKIGDDRLIDICTKFTVIERTF